ARPAVRPLPYGVHTGGGISQVDRPRGSRGVPAVSGQFPEASGGLAAGARGPADLLPDQRRVRRGAGGDAARGGRHPRATARRWVGRAAGGFTRREAGGGFPDRPSLRVLVSAGAGHAGARLDFALARNDLVV